MWPFSEGEVIVQNYNAVLSLARLVGCSNAILLHQNEAASEVCTRVLGAKYVTVDALNAEMARAAAGVLLPSRPVSKNFGVGATSGGLSDVVTTACPHPDYKLLTASSVPQMPDSSRKFATYTWHGQLKTARQMLVTGSPSEEGMNWRAVPRSATQLAAAHDLAAASAASNTAVAAVLTLRGSELMEAQSDLLPFEDPALYAPWSPSPFEVRASPVKLAGHDKSATLLANTRQIARPLEHVVSRAWRTFSSKAFLHQYDACGVDEDAFVDSFVRVEQLIESYSGLASG